MTIKNLLLAVASLVESREIIDHGAIRCLYSADVVRSIEQVEDVDEVETGTVGDDDLAERLRELAEDAGEIEATALRDLEHEFIGESVEDYVDGDAEDELLHLDALIAAAREL